MTKVPKWDESAHSYQNNEIFKPYAQISITLMRYYKTKEVAEMLGVSDRTIRRWIKAGKIRAIRTIKEYRIPESEVLKLLEEYKAKNKT